MEISGRSRKGERIWKPDLKIKIRYRKKDGKTCVTYLALSSIYKFGTIYKPVYCKWKGKEHWVVGVKAEGYIVATNYRKYEKVYYRYIMDLKILARKYAKYKILERTKVSFETYDGRFFNRLDKHYVMKAFPHKHLSKMYKRKKKE